MKTYCYHKLRAANTARQAEWDRGNQITMAFRLLELAGETGEALNLVKKLVREAMGLPGSRTTAIDLGEELSDVVICLDLIAMSADIPFEAFANLAQADYVTIMQNVQHAGFALDPLILGNRLNAAVGRLNDLAAYHGVPGERAIPSFAQAMLFAYLIAECYGIHMDEAIRRKFNKTSKANKLSIRLVSEQPGHSEGDFVIVDEAEELRVTHESYSYEGSFDPSDSGEFPLPIRAASEATFEPVKGADLGESMKDRRVPRYENDRLQPGRGPDGIATNY